MQWGVRGGATISNLRGDVHALTASLPLRHDTSTRTTFRPIGALGGVQLPFGNVFQVHLVGGGSVGLPVRSELVAPDFWFASETNIRSPDPRIEVGVVMGLEMSYRLGSAGTLLLDARFNPGVTDIPLKQTAGSVRTSTVGDWCRLFPSARTYGR